MAIRALLILAWLLTGASARAADLVVQLPQDARPRTAAAVATSMKLQSPGQIDGRTITYSNLLPATAYNLLITLHDGTVLTGVDMRWHSIEKPAADPRPLSDDDREQIRALVQDVRQFYDRSEILILQGDHDRATALVQQIRDSAFHSDKGGEVIWRVELWYFKNRHGGWERVSQTNKVLRRERFASRRLYQDQTSRIRWLPLLGGIELPKDGPPLTISLESLQPQTRPAAPSPADAASD